MSKLFLLYTNIIVISAEMHRMGRPSPETLICEIYGGAFYGNLWSWKIIYDRQTCDFQENFLT